MHVEFWRRSRPHPAAATQEDRAEKLVAAVQAMLDLRGPDGVAFVVGLEHWCLYDPAVSNWCDNENFGLATLQDNAYDGHEARRAPGLDESGYPIGGEDADYGNLLGPWRVSACDTAEDQEIVPVACAFLRKENDPWVHGGKEDEFKYENTHHSSHGGPRPARPRRPCRKR